MSLSRDRKRVERFAEFVADTGLGPRNHRRTSVNEDIASLAHLARTLREMPADSTPDPEFRGLLRGFLVATAEREGIGADATTGNSTADTAAWQALRPADSALAGKTKVVRQVPARGTARTRLALLLGVAAGAIVLSGVSAASTGALPGDPLYTVKRSTEGAQLALAGSDLSRGKLYLEFARARVAEAALVDDDQLGGVLDDMVNEVRQGVSELTTLAARDRDRGGLATLREQLLALRDKVDNLRVATNAGRAAVTRSLDELDNAWERVDAVDAAVSHECTMNGADEFGPIPAC